MLVLENIEKEKHIPLLNAFAKEIDQIILVENHRFKRSVHFGVVFSGC